MIKSTLLVATLALLASPVVAADGVCGKDGQTLPRRDLPDQSAGGRPLLADVEYSTGGALDTPATTGGVADGWGSYYLTGWHNDTGEDLILVEFGWPCGGPGPVEWVVWITDNLPGAPGTQTFAGLWTPASGDPDEFPPATYSDVDLGQENIMIPADADFYFGYENPGIGGQIDFNGTDTWAWYDGAWDPDAQWGRTALLQFTANYNVVATERSTLGQVKSLFR